MWSMHGSKTFERHVSILHTLLMQLSEEVHAFPSGEKTRVTHSPALLHAVDPLQPSTSNPTGIRVHVPSVP